MTYDIGRGLANSESWISFTCAGPSVRQFRFFQEGTGVVDRGLTQREDATTKSYLSAPVIWRRNQQPANIDHCRIPRRLDFDWRTKNLDTQHVAYARCMEIIIGAPLCLCVQNFVHIVNDSLRFADECISVRHVIIQPGVAHRLGGADVQICPRW